MRNLVAFGVAIATWATHATAQACTNGASCPYADCTPIGSGTCVEGNCYCASAADGITYISFPGTALYQKITSMNPSTGFCSSEPYSYSGALAPLDQELSAHFRGPLNLTQFAFYTLSSGSQKKRDSNMSPYNRRHGHHHVHEHKKPASVGQEGKERRDVGDMVTATINGQVESWVNSYAGAGATGGAGAPAASSDTPASTPDSSSPTNAAPAASSDSSASSAAPSVDADNGNWARQAYFNMVDGTAQGVTFLNNKGAAGISGTFDETFGNSLSYASSNGQGPAASSQVLNGFIEDDNEVIIMSSKSCSNGDCGFTRPGGVAYHGFDGPEKLFLVEFGMPTSGKTGFNMDMPAFWLLNAQIPLTLEYGQADCSCWTSGCGEFDIHEILDSGNTRGKSTLHMNPAGGSANWFQRPTTGTMKMAVILSGSQATIQVLDSQVSFDSTISGSDVSAFIHSDSVKFSLGA